MTSAHLRTNQADAHPSEFGDSVECASFTSFIPAFDFKGPFAPWRQDETCASNADKHSDGGSACVTANGADTHPLRTSQ